MSETQTENHRKSKKYMKTDEKPMNTNETPEKNQGGIDGTVFIVFHFFDSVHEYLLLFSLFFYGFH